jgi:EAL domain-containing protein (putative c-di-GMP-specific phosphodiesterase class I)/GGDEF domain-containing protein
MLVFTGINLCFDMITVYTVFHVDSVPPVINRLSHQAFIGTLMIIMVSLYLYVEVLSHSQKRFFTFKHLISMVPFIAGIGIVIFGKLYYTSTDEYAYSHGPMISALYIIITFYIILIIMKTIIFRNVIDKEKCVSIRIGLLIWIIAALIENRYPSLLLSGLAAVLMLLFIYLSFENPKEHIDEAIGALNNRAFHLMLAEKKEAGRMEKGKPLLVISIVIEDFNRIQILIGHDNFNLLLRYVAEIMKREFQTNVYHYRSNVITVMVNKNRTDIEYQIQIVAKLLKEAVNIGQYSILLKTHMDIIDTVYCKESSDELYEIMNYMMDQNASAPNDWIHELDDLLLKQKSRYTTIEKMLHKAIAEDGFMMVYQPIFSVKDRTYHSAEALVRLKDTTTVGYVSPDEFIRVAEKKGMMMELGNIVFDKVCSFFKKYRLDEMGIKYIDVNLSGIQFMYPDLHEQLRNIARAYDVAPKFFNLEITETAAIESGEMFQHNLSLLRNMGFSFSMDDFGTGYSNLSKMADIVYDLVKLDKSLLWPCFLEKSTKAHVILENVIHMLSELEVKIVAEGVETKEMADYLTDHGVNYLQGFYYAKPLKEEEFLGFLHNNSLN